MEKQSFDPQVGNQPSLGANQVYISEQFLLVVVYLI